MVHFWNFFHGIELIYVLAISSQKVINDNLKRFSRFGNKNFKEITRDDIFLFLNKLNKK